MSDLDISASQATVERALRDTILLAFGVRLPPAATVAALRATVTRGEGTTDYARGDDDLVYVTTKDACYRWNTASTEADDGDLVLKAADAGATGRWLKQSSAQRYGGKFLHQITAGVLRKVTLLYAAPTEDDVAIFLTTRPSVGIIVFGDEPAAASDAPGVVYTTDFNFALWISSLNHRPDREAALGSPVTAEQDDPGVDALDGMLKKLLAGTDLDLDGVRYVEIGAGRIQLHDQAERLFMRSRDITVKGTESNPNDPADVASIDGMDVQRRVVDLHGAGELDEDNYIGAGFGVDRGSLTTTVAGGDAVVDGEAVTVLDEVHTFTADTDTYRDLSALGAWTYVAVVGDETEPDVTADCLRVGVTRARGNEVVDDQLLAPQRFDSGDPDAIDPTS